MWSDKVREFMNIGVCMFKLDMRHVHKVFKWNKKKKKNHTYIHKQVRVTKQHINRRRNVKPIHSQMRMG